MQATIYHNPRCSKSRQTLQLLKDNGYEVNEVLYLKTPPSSEELLALAKQLPGGVRELLRSKEPEYKEWNLADTNLSEEQLLDALERQPKLLNRPIVAVGDRAVVARPPELALTLIPS